MRTACVCTTTIPQTTVADVPIALLEGEAVQAAYDTMLSCSETHVVHHLAAHPLVEASRDESFRRVLRAADLNLADGMGVVWAARMLGASTLRHRAYGPSTMLEVIDRGIDRGIRHAFVGGSTGTLTAMLRRLRHDLPDIETAGSYAPPVRDVDEATVDEDLSHVTATADIVWVGLGTPKQQRWAEFARTRGPARVIATVGAAFDFVAGAKRQAPEWVQRSGLEWAYRLASEPRRLWRRYLIGNAEFVAAVASQRWEQGRKSA